MQLDQRTLTFIGLILSLSAVLGAAQDQQDYREGFEENTDWIPLAWPDSHYSELSQVAKGAKRGRRCLSISRGGRGGQAYWRRDFAGVPKRARYFLVDAWIKTNKLSRDTEPVAWLSVHHSGFNEETKMGTQLIGGSNVSAVVKGNSGWTKLTLSGPIPDLAKSSHIYFMFNGIGVATFDEVHYRTAEQLKDLGSPEDTRPPNYQPSKIKAREISGSEDADDRSPKRSETPAPKESESNPFLDSHYQETRKSVPVTLVVARGRFRCSGTSAATDRWVQVSIPRMIDSQTVMAVDVETVPEQQVAALEFVQVDGNDYLRMHIGPKWNGEELLINLKSVVMIGSRKAPPVRQASLTKREDLALPLLPYIEPSEGIDSDDPRIKEAAQEIDRENLYEAFKSLTGILEKRMEYKGGGDQGGAETFQRGYGVCTGYANVEASLMRAAGIPTRVLSCLTIGQLQEHYIVECWAKDVGWVRYSHSADALELDDQFIILRRLAPSIPRALLSVPIYHPTSSGTTAGFAYGETEEWRASTIQEGRKLASLQMKGPAFVEVQQALRSALLSFRARKVPGQRLSLLPETDAGNRRNQDLSKLRRLLEKELP